LTELIKKVSDMFIFLNFTLHSFGLENFIPLVQIRKFQKGVIEVHIVNMQFLLGRSHLRQKLHEPMLQPNTTTFLLLLWLHSPFSLTLASLKNYHPFISVLSF
jgi:Ni,Fe-hydrogenase I cytochrome b subunit